ncbi:hypothetical protein BGX38DRAFT_1146985 [Terfezia claveryi]|nr:hypothetical protein BGX38DRAFT_1146985 [Terfezia claveryi]
MINNARKAGNPITKLVGSLKFTEVVITLLLAEEGVEGEEKLNEEGRNISESEEESGDKMQQELRIDIMLILSEWANAREYDSEKKTAAVKEERMIQASTKLLEKGRVKGPD